jgi:hypothetical protein
MCFWLLNEVITLGWLQQVVTTATVPTAVVAAVVGDNCNNGNDRSGVDGGGDEGSCGDGECDGSSSGDGNSDGSSKAT